MKAHSALLRLMGSSLAFGLCGVASVVTAHPSSEARAVYKILHVMSYHSPWRWTDGQLEGFKAGLAGLPVDIRVLGLDAKRQSDIAQLEQKAAQAHALIAEWKPDLLYASDDEAQLYVARHYINTDLPIVFSGVNEEPAHYGYGDSTNITGVVEHEHFAESLRLVQAMKSGINRVAVVFDDNPVWEPAKSRIRAAADQLGDVQFVAWDTIASFDEFKRKMREYQISADAIALLGIFNFKRADGSTVPYSEVLKWTAEHSALPDFSFWINRVHYGTLAAVTVSEKEQGLTAGRMARRILAQGVSPAAIPITATTKGVPVISLARAMSLGIQLKSSILLTTRVLRQFEWQK